MLTFLSERHLATLTTLRADGSPHVVAVGFSYDVDQNVVRVITFAGSVKVAMAGRRGRAAVSQVDGARWATLEGVARLADMQPRSRWPSPDTRRGIAAGFSAADRGRRSRSPVDKSDGSSLMGAD